MSEDRIFLPDSGDSLISGTQRIIGREVTGGGKNRLPGRGISGDPEEV